MKSREELLHLAKTRSWVWISSNQTLSEDFIREFKDELDWAGISYYQTLSEDFILEMKLLGYL